MAIDLEQARQMLLALVNVCAAENVSLNNSYGRLLAEDVAANTDFPPFDRSLMDGYAVLAGDVADASPRNPVVLKQIDIIPAGSVGRRRIGPGQTARIMTGAPLPPGADGVVRLEDAISDGTNISILAGAEAHRNVSRQGAEISTGEIVLRQGMMLDAGAMGMLGMLGKHTPLVYRRPRVGVLVTGSEIIDASEELIPGKIRNSNAYMLLAQIEDAGGKPVLLGRVPDETQKIAGVLNNMPSCDLIITTGGVSAGDYDLMKEVFALLDVKLLFHRVAIKPGMPVLAGLWQNKLLLALSGSPAGAGIVFEVLVRPVLRKMAGDSCLWRPSVEAVLQEGIRQRTASRRFIQAQCYWRGHRWEVLPLFFRHNGMLKSMIFANALIDVPPGSPPLAAGETVTVILLNQRCFDH